MEQNTHTVIINNVENIRDFQYKCIEIEIRQSSIILIFRCFYLFHIDYTELSAGNLFRSRNGRKKLTFYMNLYLFSLN